ncbi:MAG: ribosome assembly cofactor RimP [Bacteroidales bacterium]|nr:ribosome assembly cofactor RimP [Bacteroidales bacterium]
MINQNTIEKLVNDCFEGSELFLVSTKVLPDNTVEIYIDSDGTVGIDDCAMLNLYIEEHLDRDIEDYSLTVSSAGLSAPLMLLRQYKKHLGQEVSVVKKDGEKIIGTLKEADDKNIIVTVKHTSKAKKGVTAKVKEQEDIVIAQDEISCTKILLDFNL